MQLTDRALLMARERFQNFYMPQNREWDGDDSVIAARFKSTGARLLVDDHLLGSLIDGNHLGAKPDSLSEL